VKVAHRKKSTNYFLQNEANIATMRVMHDKASYHALIHLAANEIQYKESAPDTHLN